MRDPYQVLGVSRSDSGTDIKRAFRKLAKTWHPDQNQDNPEAKDKFSEISQAYEILSDTEKRAAFDRGEIDAEGKPRSHDFSSAFGGGTQRPGGGTFRWQTGAGRQQGAFDPEDILSQIFGATTQTNGSKQHHSFSSEQEQRRKHQGADVTAQVAVTLEQIASGDKIRVELPNGRTLNIAPPKGVTDGQHVRLRGQGEAGGDAHVIINFIPHPLFRIDGVHLRLDLPLSLDEAVLGATIRVPALNSAVNMKIPPMTSGERIFRLKGKGLPTKHNGFGDILVQTRITLPDKSDADLTLLMERWREIEKQKNVRGSEYQR